MGCECVCWCVSFRASLGRDRGVRDGLCKARGGVKSGTPTQMHGQVSGAPEGREKRCHGLYISVHGY
jgi:hypothetical protein